MYIHIPVPQALYYDVWKCVESGLQDFVKVLLASGVLLCPSSLVRIITMHGMASVCNAPINVMPHLPPLGQSVRELGGLD